MIKHGALVLGRSRQVVTVVRSLSRAGYQVILGRELRKRISDYSRYVDETWEHPRVIDHAAFLDALSDFLSSRPEVSVVFPVGEDALTCFARHPERLAGSAAVVMAEPETTLLCMQKHRVYELLREIDVPFPRTLTVSNMIELWRGAEEIGFPVSIKPTSSARPFHPKALICRSADELRQRLASWPEGHASLVLQRYAPGLRHGCDLMAVDGEVTAYFEFRALRSDWHDGTGMTVSAITVPPTPALYEYCRRLIRRLNYSGPAAIQMLVDDATGEINFLEINPRLDASCAFSVACGYDFPAMGASWAEAKKQGVAVTPPAPRGYRAGVRGVWLTGDLDGLVLALSRRAIDAKTALWWLACAAGASMRARMHLIFRWDDPLPAVRSGVNVMRAFGGMILRRIPALRWDERAARRAMQPGSPSRVPA